MDWMPALKIGWLNGWLPLAALALTEWSLFLLFPREVVARLFDRSGWSQKQVVFTVIGKVLALACLILLFLTPLKVGSVVFVIGLVVVALGLSGLVKALFDFKNTPLDEPVTRGLYRVSRHPQIVMTSVILLGSCLAIGSWLALLLLVAARVFSHLSILAEEEACLRQYGDPYRAYVDRVPRYFVIF